MARHEASFKGDTPFGKGAVDHVAHEQQSRHQDYKPFVKNEAIVPLDPYLEQVLQTDSITPEDQDILDDIGSSPEFHNLLVKGKKPKAVQHSLLGVRRSDRIAGQRRPQLTSASASCDPQPPRSTDNPLNVVSGTGKRSRDALDDTGDSTQSSAKRKRLNESSNGWCLQCASYALEMFNRGGVRTHVVGILIVDDELQLSLYTRSGSCHTEKFSFVDNSRTFLRLLLAFSRMSLADWGIVPEIQSVRLSEPSLALEPHTIDSFIFSKQTFVLNGVKYVLEEVSIFPRGLVSRGTWIIRATFKQDTTKIRVVVKICTAQPTEWSFVDTAVTTAKSDDKHAWVLSHLPEIYNRSKKDVEMFSSLFRIDYEKRALSVLVAEQLQPLTDLTDPQEMASAFKDTIEGTPPVARSEPKDHTP
ncbi:hypothetical protein VNI00_011482 [Paramarasmius palmivorus]|uniref:Fungal-type protein kinase domain-containing protein n=1 Tax=Paramarasmius palmivorus TaxID=297713 RepID=A0AAW0CET6_9AGAR